MAGAPSDSVLRHLQRLFHTGTSAGATDGRLLDQFLDGDEEGAAAAFAVLVERHGPMVLRVCRRVLGDSHDAEDASQATFLVLARKARTVRRRDSVASWLFGVANRVAHRARVDAARRREHERRRAEMTARYGDDEGAVESWPELYEELARLPEKYRAPIVLFHLEGLTLAEAAVRLGCPSRTVQRRLSEGRERLRGRLSRRGVMFPAGLLVVTRAAEMPAALAEAIVRAAGRGAAGRAATAGAVSASVAAMTEGVIRTMFWTTIRSGAAALAAMAAVTTLAAGFAISPREADPPAVPAPADPPLMRAFDGPLPATAPRRVLDLRVADAATGAAVADAEVSVLEYRQNKFHVFPTDAGGRLRAEYPVVDEMMPVVEVRKPGYVPQRHSLGAESGNPPDKPLSVRLRTATSIGGTVVDEAGVPIAGAMVVVTASAYAEPRTRPKLTKGTETTYEVPATTDGQGRWRCEQVSPDASKVTLQLIHPDYVSGSTTTLAGPGLRTPAMAGLRDLSDRQVMTRGVRVAGRVLGAQGRPIAGAEVVEASRGLPFLAYLRRARTDTDGRFHFHFEPGERVTLTVQAKGFAPSEMARRVGAGDEPIEFRLAPGRTLHGRVVDHRGEPLAETMVFFSSLSRLKGVSLNLRTDADGRFRWDEAPDEAVPLSFSKQGYLGLERQPVKPSDREAVIVLRPALTVTVAVREATSGAVVKPFTIEAGGVNAETGEVAWDSELTRVINDGEYRLLLDGTRPAYRFRVRAQGREPFLSRVLRGDEGQVDFDVKLEARKGPGLSGLVRLPDGSPLADAEVVAGGMVVRTGKPHDPGQLTRAGTDSGGRFSLPPVEEDFPLSVVSDHGFAWVTREQWGPDGAITVRPWGRVEGELRIGNQPGAGRKVDLIIDRIRGQGEHEAAQEESTMTDEAGRFVFEKVIPSRDIRLFHDVDRAGKSRSGGVLVEVRSGEVTRVTVGGGGRPVIGRIVRSEGVAPGSDDWEVLRITLESNRPKIPDPTRPDRARAWWDSEEGRTYRRSYVSLHVDASGTGGAFRFEDVPAGEYRVIVSSTVRPTERPLSRLPATLRHTFLMPEIPGGRGDEPYDLGPLRPTLEPALKEGDPAPPLAARTLDGRALDLKEFRGRYVLLDFWATWCGPCIAELPYLKEVHDAFGRDDRFAMVSLSLDDQVDEPRAFVAKQGLGWTQGHLGPWSGSAAAKAYHVDAIPAILLIGPDGRVLSTRLRREQIRSAVATALARE